jgi:SNF2 family DNA or RNA helicase
VGTPRAGGRGLTLTRASTVVYYSHDFSYETRVQSEDRAHRLGLAHSVTYVDLVAEDTVDRHLLGSVADKRDLAALFDRDDPTAFLR